jgi:hypothetical protein
MEIIQSVTSNRRDIPSHFIAISSFGCHKGNTDKKASTEYKVLYRAWCDEQIGGIKFMANPHDKRGQIFVDPADAQRLINASIRPKATLPTAPSKRATDLQYESVCESLGDIASGLGHVVTLLERLATAVESIATAPKQHEPVAAWRDMNGELMN